MLVQCTAAQQVDASSWHARVAHCEIHLSRSRHLLKLAFTAGSAQHLRLKYSKLAA
jgi:hypothetical protein